MPEDKLTPEAAVDPNLIADGEGGEDAAVVLEPIADEIQEGEPTEAELAMLTEEERAALSDDEDEEEGAGDADADPAPVVEAVVVAAPEVAAVVEQAPAVVAPPIGTEDMKAIMAAVNEQQRIKRREITDEYDEGGLTREEYETKLQELEATSDSAIEQATAEVQWARYEAEYKAEVRSYLSEYPGLTEKGVIERLDRHVKYVSGSEDYAALTPREQLEAAHQMLVAEASILKLTVPAIAVPKPAAPTVPAVPAVQEAAKPAAKPKPTPVPKPPVVPTLASIPAAAAMGVSDGKFGNLQRIVDEGDAHQIEAAMAKLSPAEREAFSSMDY